MKEKFEALVEHLVGNGFFLEEVVELLERTLIERTLERTGGNRSAASKLLGIHRNTLQRKMAEYNLGAPQGCGASPCARNRGRGERPLSPDVNRIDLLIFDLDGTLIDSRLDLAHAVNATRGHMGMPPIDNERVYSYVGNGAPVLIRRVLGEAATRGAGAGRRWNSSWSITPSTSWTTQRCIPACGKRSTACGTRACGWRCSPTSRCASAGQFSMAWGSAGISCRSTAATASISRSRIPSGIETLRQEWGTARERTMMVGDSSVDIQTARNAQVKSCGVTYGFQPESLAAVPPDLQVDRMEALADWIVAPEAG